MDRALGNALVNAADLRKSDDLASMVIRKVGRKDPPQMPFVQNDDVVEAFAAAVGTTKESTDARRPMWLWRNVR